MTSGKSRFPEEGKGEEGEGSPPMGQVEVIDEFAPG